MILNYLFQRIKNFQVKLPKTIHKLLHPVYLTKNSIRLGFKNLGLKISKIFTYNYPQENALAVHLVQQKKIRIYKNEISSELKLGSEFVRKIKIIKKKIENNIIKYNKGERNIVLFGAGHRSIFFIKGLLYFYKRFFIRLFYI